MTKGLQLKGSDHAEGNAFARRWRDANHPYFDSLYGPNGDHAPDQAQPTETLHQLQARWDAEAERGEIRRLITTVRTLHRLHAGEVPALLVVLPLWATLFLAIWIMLP